jgi:hypothetical protein
MIAKMFAFKILSGFVGLLENNKKHYYSWIFVFFFFFSLDILITNFNLNL